MQKKGLGVRALGFRFVFILRELSTARRAYEAAPRQRKARMQKGFRVWGFGSRAWQQKLLALESLRGFSGSGCRQAAAFPCGFKLQLLEQL